MKDNLSKNVEIFFKYLSLFIVVKYSITTMYDIYKLINNNDVNNFLNEYVRVLQNFIFFGSFLSIFLSRFKSFSLILPFCFLEVKYSFFNTNIAPIFMSNISQMSPEYIRIFIFIFIIGIFLFRSIWKKRKFTDIFLLLSMSGVLITATIFHIITLKQLDYFSKSQEKTWVKVMQYKNVEDFCIHENLTCQKIEDQEQINKEYIKLYYKNLKTYIDKNDNYFYYSISSDNSTQSRILARKPLAFVKYDKKTYYILDDVSYTEYLKFNERIFGILALSSHIVWIFGALYLIYFHSKRKTIK